MTDSLELAINWFAYYEGARYALWAAVFCLLVLAVFARPTVLRGMALFFGVALSTAGIFAYEALEQRRNKDDTVLQQAENHKFQHRDFVFTEVMLASTEDSRTFWLSQLLSVLEEHKEDLVTEYLNQLVQLYNKDGAGQAMYAASVRALPIIHHAWLRDANDTADVAMPYVAEAYIRIIDEMKETDPERCRRFMVDTDGDFRGEARDIKLSAMTNMYATKFNTEDKPVTTSSKEDAIFFAQEIIGPDAMAGLFSRSAAPETICDNLSAIFTKATEEKSPRAAAAVRHWIAPVAFYQPQ